MNARRFDQLCASRRRPVRGPLMQSRAVRGLLQTAADNLRLRTRVHDELARLLPPELSAGVQVTGDRRGITLVAADARLRQFLVRELAGLRARLSGVARLSVVQRNDGDATDGHGGDGA